MKYRVTIKSVLPVETSLVVGDVSGSHEAESEALRLVVEEGVAQRRSWAAGETRVADRYEWETTTAGVETVWTGELDPVSFLVTKVEVIEE